MTKPRRAVLAARNKDVDSVNGNVFVRVPANGPNVELLSADSTEEEGKEAAYPVEF